jgi:hypothetical protein
VQTFQTSSLREGPCGEPWYGSGNGVNFKLDAFRVAMSGDEVEPYLKVSLLLSCDGRLPHWRGRCLEAGVKGMIPVVLSLPTSCRALVSPAQQDRFWERGGRLFPEGRNQTCLQRPNAAHHSLRQTHSFLKRTLNRVRDGK